MTDIDSTRALVASATSSARHASAQDFLFGVATAAYQIEGAAHEDGRTDSIWDAFCARARRRRERRQRRRRLRSLPPLPRRRRAIMADLGIQTYRFSTSWSRVRPDGGPVNAEGSRLLLAPGRRTARARTSSRG